MDITHSTHRNKVFLMTYTEYLYRELLNDTSYSMDTIQKLVDQHISLEDLNKFFDKFTILFAEWAVTQPWDKTSASLGVDDNGKNVAKSTEELLVDFKQFLNTRPI